MSARLVASCFALPLLSMLTLPSSAAAQTAPASASSSATTPATSMAGIDHGNMEPIPMHASAAGKPHAAMSAATSARQKPGASETSMDGMHDMNHGTMSAIHADAAMHRVPDGSPPTMDHSSHVQDPMGSMSMDAMQGGSAPPGARSPDYSDGVIGGPMQVHREENEAIGKLWIDQLEAFHRRYGHGQSWELGGWYGTDANKLWLRSEGERSAGKLQDGDAEVFWNHPIATYWGSQLGVRQDFGIGPGRTWAALGVEGLAPYWFDLEATGYVGSSGRTAARLRVHYDVLFTQRLILTSELEANFYGMDDRARGIGRGLSDVQFGLRLRYEIRREFAPYIGINWVRRFGNTADYARADGEHALDRQIVAGVRIWF